MQNKYIKEDIKKLVSFFYLKSERRTTVNKKYFEDYNDPQFLYQMLSRLESDCKYFLENGEVAEKHLWALSVDNQISAMKEIYNKLKEKPESLSLEQINAYEKEMKAKLSEKRINTNERNFKDNIKTEQIFKKIYQDLKEEILKKNKKIFIKEYEIPSKNYSNDMNSSLWWASGIAMELEQMMKQFDDKVFFYSYKDKYFFSNSEQKAKEIMSKEIEKEVQNQQRNGRIKRKNRDVR